jgi:hypothetical protein
MGQARQFAETVDLIHMEPDSGLASTGYAIAHPGQEYLVLRTNDDDADFSITLVPGTYAARWHDIESRETIHADPVIAEQAGQTQLRTPFEPTVSVVVHLKSAPG